MGRGKQIKTIEELFDADMLGKSVTWTCYDGVANRAPVAFFISMPAITVMRFIKRGLFLYKKEKH